jgi:hypothetical protein
MLRKEHRLRVFENRVLKSIFGHNNNRDELTRGCKKLHNEGLHNLYSTSNILGDQIKKNEMLRACSAEEKDEKCV